MKLHIKNLRFPAIIGVHDWEKERRRQFYMDITVEYDASEAVLGDDFHKALDYGKIEEQMIALAESREWQLIETLADKAGDHLLREFQQISEVTIALTKPQAMHFSESVTAIAHKKR